MAILMVYDIHDYVLKQCYDKTEFETKRDLLNL